MSTDKPFPLDAEQIVRGIGFLTAMWIDHTRGPGVPQVDADGLTIALASVVGVPLQTEAGRLGRRVVAPYRAPNGAKIQPEASSALPPIHRGTTR